MCTLVRFYGCDSPVVLNFALLAICDFTHSSFSQEPYVLLLIQFGMGGKVSTFPSLFHNNLENRQARGLASLCKHSNYFNVFIFNEGRF